MNWENSIGNSFDWGLEIINKEQKELVAKKITSYVKNNQTIGIGSGSTVFLSLTHIAKKVKSESLNIKVIPTSFEIELVCSSLGLAITTLKQDKPDWYFDGADEVDPNNNLIKGRGGAMFREKLLLVSSEKNYIIVDDSKMVDRLGTNFLVPIEVYPDSINYVRNCLIKMGAVKLNLRIAQKKDGPVITENGNFIVDVEFKAIKDNYEKDIKQIVGVVESGLFQDYELTIIKP